MIRVCHKYQYDKFQNNDEKKLLKKFDILNYFVTMRYIVAKTRIDRGVKFSL